LDVYSFDCQAATGYTSLVTRRTSQTWLSLDKAAGEFRLQMTQDVGKLNESIFIGREMLKAQERHKKDFSSMLDGIAKEICERVEQLKNNIDSQKRVLMQEIDTRRKERTKQIQHVIEDIEQHILFTTKLIKDTEEIRDKGTAKDIVQRSSALHKKADELAKLDNIKQEVNNLGSLQVKFEAAKMPAMSSEKQIGQVQWLQNHGGK
jgi:hypothetical protein